MREVLSGYREVQPRGGLQAWLDPAAQLHLQNLISSLSVIHRLSWTPRYTPSGSQAGCHLFPRLCASMSAAKQKTE